MNDWRTRAHRTRIFIFVSYFVLLIRHLHVMCPNSAYQRLQLPPFNSQVESFKVILYSLNRLQVPV